MEGRAEEEKGGVLRLGGKGKILESIYGDKGSIYGDKGSIYGDKGSIYGDKGKILESIYEDEVSDYSDFELLMQKIELLRKESRLGEVEQSVKGSVESVREGLSMDPFL